MNFSSQIKFYKDWFKYTPHFRKLVVQYPFLKDFYNIFPPINTWVENSPKWRDWIRSAGKNDEIRKVITDFLNEKGADYKKEMTKIHNQYEKEVVRIKNRPKSIQEEELTEVETIKIFFGSDVYSERVENEYNCLKSMFRVQELSTIDKDALVRKEIDNIKRLFAGTVKDTENPLLFYNPYGLKSSKIKKLYDGLIAGDEDSIRSSCIDTFKDAELFKNLINTKAIYKYLKYLEEPQNIEPAIVKEEDIKTPIIHSNGIDDSPQYNVEEQQISPYNVERGNQEIITEDMLARIIKEIVESPANKPNRNNKPENNGKHFFSPKSKGVLYDFYGNIGGMTSEQSKSDNPVDWKKVDNYFFTTLSDRLKAAKFIDSGTNDSKFAKIFSTDGVEEKVDWISDSIAKLEMLYFMRLLCKEYNIIEQERGHFYQTITRCFTLKLISMERDPETLKNLKESYSKVWIDPEFLNKDSKNAIKLIITETAKDTYEYQISLKAE